MNTTPWDALLLRQTRAAEFDRCQETPAALTTSKAGQVRRLLRSGPMSAAAICMEVEIRSTSLVGPVLKHDLAMGRVRFVNGLYELASDFEQELQQRIRQAKALLESNGYSVEELS